MCCWNRLGHLFMIYKCMLHSVLPFGKLLSSPVQSEILIGFFTYMLRVLIFIFLIGFVKNHRCRVRSWWVAKLWAKRALLTHPTNLGSKWECTLHMMHGVNGWHMAACMFAHCDWWFHLCVYRCQTSSWLKTTTLLLVLFWLHLNLTSCAWTCSGPQPRSKKQLLSLSSYCSITSVAQ